MPRKDQLREKGQEEQTAQYTDGCLDGVKVGKATRVLLRSRCKEVVVKLGRPGHGRNHV